MEKNIKVHDILIELSKQRYKFCIGLLLSFLISLLIFSLSPKNHSYSASISLSQASDSPEFNYYRYLLNLENFGIKNVEVVRDILSEDYKSKYFNRQVIKASGELFNKGDFDGGIDLSKLEVIYQPNTRMFFFNLESKSDVEQEFEKFIYSYLKKLNIKWEQYVKKRITFFTTVERDRNAAKRDLLLQGAKNLIESKIILAEFSIIEPSKDSFRYASQDESKKLIDSLSKIDDFSIVDSRVKDYQYKVDHLQRQVNILKRIDTDSPETPKNTKVIVGEKKISFVSISFLILSIYVLFCVVVFSFLINRRLR